MTETLQAVLHVPTLMLLVILGYLLLGLLLQTALPGLQSRPEFRRWLLSNWVILGGFVMLAARLLIAPGWSIFFGNALLFLGIALQYQAMSILLYGHRGPAWLMQVQPLVWLMLGLMLHAQTPLPQRTMILSVLLCLFVLAFFRLIVRDGWRFERSLRTMVVTTGFTAMGLAVRAWHAWSSPELYDSQYHSSLGQGMAYLCVFLLLISSGFGFTLAVLERMSKEMKTLASTDGLTGCWNRMTTDSLLTHELQNCQRRKTSLVLALLDLDHFKQINDEHGHLVGDAVLRRFASIIRDRLRESDTFGRVGGEEFALVLPDTDAAGASTLLEALRSEVAITAFETGAETAPRQVTFSIGLSVTQLDRHQTALELYSQADQALYAAKRNGRNRLERFDA